MSKCLIFESIIFTTRLIFERSKTALLNRNLQPKLRQWTYVERFDNTTEIDDGR